MMTTNRDMIRYNAEVAKEQQLNNAIMGLELKLMLKDLEDDGD